MSSESRAEVIQKGDKWAVRFAYRTVEMPDELTARKMQQMLTFAYNQGADDVRNAIKGILAIKQED